MPTDNDEPTPEPIELRRFDLHSLWRVLLWGSSAAMALAVVAGTTFSDVGSERLKQTIASILEPAKLGAPIDTRAQQLAELEKQTRDLTQTVRDLTTERDRVKTRLASLEQSLEDITGAVKKQSAQIASQQSSALDQPKPPAPTVSAPPTVSATASSPSPLSSQHTPQAPQATASTSKDASPTGATPVPASRVASAAPTAMAKPEAVAEPAPVTRKEMGIDIGGAPTIEALRTYWAGIKANAGPDLVGLLPSFTIRHKANAAPDYRLIVGPFPNGVTALRICAKLALNHIPCRAGTYTVQQLAER